MTNLYGRDKSVISRHIRNIFLEGELEREPVVAKNATTAADGKIYQVEYYNSKGQPTEQALTGLGSNALFEHEFPISYQGPAFDQNIPLGTVTLYSNDQLVFERLKYGFILILVNSIIKTFMLWFIIYFFINILVLFYFLFGS